MMNKQNDWIVANINNPNFEVGDFKHIADMSLNNTQLLSKDIYLKSDFIRNNEVFKNSKGEFDEDKFNNFYTGAVNKFQEFIVEDNIDNRDSFEYSMWDVTRPKDGKIKNPNFGITTQINPNHNTIGVIGFNELGPSTKSRRELAQESKIYDTESGKFLDKSVNDISFTESPMEYFKSLFDEPLVYATYDEDTEEIDPTTGKSIIHKKGDWKVNDEGEYYTETLNGRSLVGKQIVSAADYLTSESNSFNKYDFLDSDDLDKSTSGIIAKNIASVLPLFIPYVNTAYSGLIVARELSKTLPMLYGIVEGLSGEENPNSKLLNNIAAYGEKLTTSSSDYASQNTFSFENFANLMSDVATQWGQQRFIANTFTSLTTGGKKAMASAQVKAANEYRKQVIDQFKKVADNELEYDKFVKLSGVSTANFLNLSKDMIESGKWMDTAFGKAALNKYIPKAQKVLQNRMRIGQDLSLVYMALISNTDVYSSVLQKGATPFEAACISLGSIIGMFSVDKFLGLGEMFFQSEPARLAIRQSVKSNADKLMTSMGIKSIENEVVTKKGILGLIERGIQSGRKSISDYREQIKDRTLGFTGKSLGEGLEEVSEEVVTDLSKTLGEVAGALGYFSQDDYGAWDNAFERYTMSFLGGAAGGGLFYGVDLFQNRHRNTSEFEQNLLYLLRQNKKGDIFKELDHEYQRERFGSNNLSYKDPSITVTDKKESQNYFVYQTLKKTINQLEMILNDNGLGINDNELFNRMVQGEYRQNALTDFLKGNNTDVKEVSYITRYYEDFQRLAQKIVDKQSEIDNLTSTTLDIQKRTPEYDEKLNNLKKEKEELIKYRDYLFGEGSLGYVERTLFAMDPGISGKLIDLNYNQFVRSMLGKEVSELTEQEDSYLKKKFEEESKNKKMELDVAFQLFKSMQSQTNPTLQKLSKIDYKKYEEQLREIIKNDPINRVLSWNDKLESESDEDYNFRDKQQENESKENFEKRKSDRKKKLQDYNQQNLYKWVQEFAKLQLDRSSFRTLLARLGTLKDYEINQILSSFYITNNQDLTQKFRNILLTSDLSDMDKVYNQMFDIAKKSILEEIKANDQYVFTIEWSPMRQQMETLPLDVLENLSSEEENELRAKFDFNSYSYQDSDVVRYIDLARSVKLKLLSENKDITNVENIKQVLLDLLFADESAFKGIEPRFNDFLKYYSQFIAFENEENEELSLKGDEAFEFTEEMAEQEAEDQAMSLLNEVKPFVDEKIIKKINESQEIQALIDLEKSKFIDNPVLDLVKVISTESRESETDLESFLEDLYSKFHKLENPNEFELSKEQLDTINKFRQDIDIATAFIKAASSSREGFQNPIGHNKSINDFVKNHSDVFKNIEELPEIDHDFGEFLISELNRYNQELSAWEKRFQMNKGNKDQRFIRADKGFTQARLDLFKINRDAFKISPTLDLLDGYEELDLNSDLLSVIKIEKLLRDNYNKARNSGKSFEELIDPVISKITKSSTLGLQTSTKLDENIRYSNFTDYDKFISIISAIGLDNDAFYNDLYSFINGNEKFIPLSIQEHAAKIIYVQQHNQKLVNEALEYLKKKTGSNLDILPNSGIVSGVGGSGKTYAVTKLSVNDGENVWVSGPTDSQIKNLQSNLQKSEGKTIEELFNLFLGESEATSFLNSVKWDSKNNKWIDSTNGKFYSVTEEDGKFITNLNKDIKINKLTKKPKTIVIDEATHLSTASILMLSKAANENGINIIFIGDRHQNGYSKNRFMHNLSTSSVIAWRTPELFISLRDSNLQKLYNLSETIKLIDTLQETQTEQEKVSAFNKLINDDFKNFTLNYYLDDEFNGELITTEIDQNLESKLDGKIGFIGNENSAYYQQLKKSGKNVILVDPLTVQGREFNYTVVDIPWKLDLLSGTSFNHNFNNGIRLQKFLTNLYTMISRSQKGTIIIDNGLSKLVKNKKDSFKGVSTSMSEASDKFKKDHIREIDRIIKYFKSLNKLPKEDSPKKEIPPEGKSENNDEVSNNNENDNQDNGEDNNNENEDEKENNEEETNTDDVSSNITPETPIQGTKIKIKDLNPEILPIVEATAERNEESQEAKEQDEKSSLTMDSPIRIYGNVSFSGIDISRDEWTNESNSRKDLGIFLRKGESVNSGVEKEALVRKLLNLKSIINFGIKYYDRLSPEEKRIIPENLFENEDNIKYYISVEDETPENSLVGLTTLKNNERTFGEIPRIFKLVAVFKDKNGNDCEITLGGLANPKKWKDNYEDIKTAIQKKIDENVPEAEELKEYIKQLKSIIDSYEDNINELSKKVQKYRIYPPKFSGLSSLVDTELEITLPNETKKIIKTALRLENLNDTGSPYFDQCHYAVCSPIFTITKDIPGVNHYMVGRPAMYESSNTLLYSSELEELYLKQKSDPSITPQVRMIALDNVGIEFKSLYDKNYQELYTISKGDTLYVTPFHLEPMAIRMYISMWNYRSNLSKFLDFYNEWLQKIGKSEKEIQELCKLDNKTYNQLVHTYGIDRNGESYLTEKEYREKIPEDIKEKVKIIWEFNDSLASLVREFRLGYNKENGAYIRNLTNLKEGEFYKDISNVQGVYINPSVAAEQLRVLNVLFENIINKIIVPPTDNTKKYITEKLAEDWFKVGIQKQSFEVEMTDLEGKSINTSIRIDKEHALAKLPIAIIETAKFLHIRDSGLGNFSFDDYYDNPEKEKNKDKRFILFFNEERLNWRSLAWALDKGNSTSTNLEIDYENEDNIPGIIPYSIKDGKKVGVYDARIDHLFSLMFHGVLSTSKYNRFDTGDIRATDASFKFGFFSDPILEKKTKDDNTNALVATNRKLFAADKVVGFPYIAASLKPYQESEEKPKKEETNQEVQEINQILIQEINSAKSILSASDIQLSKKSIQKIKSIDDLYNLVNKEINRKFKQFFNSHDDISKINTLITEVEKTDDGHLKFKYFPESSKIKGKFNGAIEWKGKALMISTLDENENEIIYSVQDLNGNGNLIWERKTVPNNEPKTAKQVINEIQECISLLQDDKLDKDYKPAYNDALNSLNESQLAKNPGDTIVSKELIQKAANNIQELLNKWIQDNDGDNELFDEIANKVIDRLTDVKNITNCYIG